MKIIVILGLLLSTYSQIFTQSKYSDIELNQMLNTYAFYLGQITAVQEIINRYPELKIEAHKAQNAWNIQFGSSIENIIKELKLDLGEKFNDFENEILESILILDYSEVTEMDARNTVKEIERRAQGDMPTPFFETLLIYNPIYQIKPEIEMRDGFTSEFISKETDGLRVMVKYPRSWKAQKGDRPHVIQKFKSENGHGLEHALLMIAKVDIPLSTSDIKLLLSEEGIKQQLPQNSKIIAIKTGMAIDNIPLASATFYYEQLQMQFKFGLITELYIMYYNNYQITLMFGVGSKSNSYDDSFKVYETHKNLFWRMANNLVILSKYE